MNLVGVCGGGNLQREKGGMLSVIIYREPPPACSVTVLAPNVGLIVARGRPTPQVWERRLRSSPRLRESLCTPEGVGRLITPGKVKRKGNGERSRDVKWFG